jgi:hypothetical protein
MNTKTKIIGITLVAALAAPSFSAANEDRKGKGKRGGHHMGQMIDQIALWDGNGDGQVTQDEINAFRAARLAEFDTNADGTLSLEEYEALWADAMRERMVDMFQRHDDDGDGIVTATEFAERYENTVARLDRNDDGVLSKDDLRGKRGQRGEGRHGGGGDGDGE